MKIAVIGYAQTKFGELWDKGLRDLINGAGNEALKNSNIKAADVDNVICANSLGIIVNGQSNVNSLCFEELGIKSSALISCGDASGAEAIRQAMLEIESGKSDIVMVLGVEKVTDLSSLQIVTATSKLLDQDAEAYNGATLTSIYAMISQLYMKEFDLKEKDIAKIPVKNHKNALVNDNAQFRFEITEEAVLNSPFVASPIRMLNNSSICDGAAAIILCKEELAKKYSKEPVFLIASGTGNDSLALHSRKKLTEMPSTKNAAESAYKQSKIKASDISIAEVHDITSISEIIAVEDLGLCKKGEGLKLIENGKIWINTSGGLKACGHPLAATGIRQAIDVCTRLKEKKGYGLTQTLSGSGSLAIVNIFSR